MPPPLSLSLSLSPELFASVLNIFLPPSPSAYVGREGRRGEIRGIVQGGHSPVQSGVRASPEMLATVGATFPFSLCSGRALVVHKWQVTSPLVLRCVSLDFGLFLCRLLLLRAYLWCVGGRGKREGAWLPSSSRERRLGEGGEGGGGEATR